MRIKIHNFERYCPPPKKIKDLKIPRSDGTHHFCQHRRFTITHAKQETWYWNPWFMMFTFCDEEKRREEYEAYYQRRAIEECS